MLPFPAMPVSHEYKAIFVHIPRAGGSSIEKVLGIYGRRNDGENSPCHDLLFGISHGVQMQHLTIHEIRDRMDRRAFEGYFKFAFVRNPYDRILSAYLWSEDAKCMNLRELLFDVFAPGKSRAMELYRARHQEYGFRGHRRRLTFREFLLEVVRPNREKPLETDLDRHFRSQYEFLHDPNDPNGTLLVDFVGRYEKLGEDFRKVGDVLGLTAELSRVNATRHGPYREYYDEETRNLVREMYRSDLETLGYRFEE
jgi:hypothetical protein